MAKNVTARAKAEWRAAVNRWFDLELISSAKVIAEDQILVVPGKGENFGFHFSRELIPIVDDFVSGIRSELDYETDADGNYILSFGDWKKLSPWARIVFKTFRERSTKY